MLEVALALSGFTAWRSCTNLIPLGLITIQTPFSL